VPDAANSGFLKNGDVVFWLGGLAPKSARAAVMDWFQTNDALRQTGSALGLPRAAPPGFLGFL
jgi:hypothetical protein